MKCRPKQTNIAIQAVSGKLMKKWMTMLFGRIGKGLFVKQKYRTITNSLCEYINELVVSRAVDVTNKAWYNERLASSAHLLSLILAKDGIRFITNLIAEDKEIRRSQMLSSFAEDSVDQWNKFAESANRWSAKYYPNSKTLTRGYL